MADKVFIAHSIYLTPDERKALATEPTTLETVGISVPADPTNLQKRLEEIFVKYIVSNHAENKSIEVMPGGYKINFPRAGEFRSIKDHRDEGVEWMLVFMESKTEAGDVLNHQIVFKDISVLEKTTVVNQLQFKHKVE